MGLFRRPKHNCYCAFCRSPRQIYRKKNINLVNIFASAFMAAISMFALWREFDPRVMVIFVFCLGIAETFVKIRWRLSLTCQQCGFDPILYRKDIDAAVAKVKMHLDRRKEDPRYLLARKLDIPTISPGRALVLKNEQTAKEKRGTLVSRQI